MSSLRSARAKRRAARQRNMRITAIAIGVIVLGFVIFAVYSSIQNGNQKGNGDMITTASGLQYQDLITGTGAAVKAGDIVSVHYTGWLEDGTKFDSSLDRNQPFDFTVGQGGVIKGWDEGLVGMQVGGKRKLVIPSNLGYGSAGAGGVIPPNATLVFEVELLEIK